MSVSTSKEFVMVEVTVLRTRTSEYQNGQKIP